MIPVPILDSLVGVVGKVIDRVFPDPAAAAAAKLELYKLREAGDLRELEIAAQVAVAQTEINRIEAAQPGIFKGGWRPAAGWVCVGGLAYTPARALLPWIATVVGVPNVPPLPPIDTSELMALLFGLLGLGTLRTSERLRGKA